MNTRIIRVMESEGHDGASPSTMHAFLLSRSRDSPKAMLFYLMMLHAEVTILFRRAERLNEFETFMSAIRLLLPFASTQHATKYIRISCEWLVYLKVCSPAEAQVIQNRCFTLQSEHGARVAIDYIHEKYVNLIRDKTGKNHKVGHKAKIEYAATCSILDVNSGNSKKAMELLRNSCYLSVDPTSATSFDARTYSLVTKVLEENDIFGREEEQRKLISPLTDKELDGNVLSIPKIGNDVAAKYGKLYHEGGKKVVSRSEKDIKIPSITAAGTKMDENAKKRIKLATSTILDEISSSGTKAEILREFENIRPFLLSSQTKRIPKTVGAVGKTVMCQLLSNLRVTAFNRRPGLVHELEQRVKQEMVVAETTPEQRLEQLSDPFCSLHGCVCRNEEAFRLRRAFPDSM